MKDIAMEAAFRYLKGAEKTEAELRSNLALKGVTPANVERVVDYCLKKAYVSDERVASRTVELAKTRAQTGRDKVGEALLRRGVDRDVVAEALSSYSDEDELATALAFLKRKLAPTDSPQKAARMLVAKGFSEETVRRTLESCFPGHDW